MAFLLDSLLTGGVKFVLQRLADTVEGELNNEERLKEELLRAQMQLELGEIEEEAFFALEKEILLRLHEIKVRKRGETTMKPGAKVAGVEVDFHGDEDR